MSRDSLLDTGSRVRLHCLTDSDIRVTGHNQVIDLVLLPKSATASALYLLPGAPMGDGEVGFGNRYRGWSLHGCSGRLPDGIIVTRRPPLQLLSWMNSMSPATPDSAETRRLLECARAGEKSAFEQLFVRQRAALRRLTALCLEARDSAVAFK